MTEILGIDQLAPLVGAWTMTASVDGRTTATGTVHVLVDRRRRLPALALRSRSTGAGDPAGMGRRRRPSPSRRCSVVDDTSGDVRMLYADARGVRRIYGSSLVDGVWRQWRDAPGFFQRFAATVGPDGRTLTGAWESSSDGERWAHDFAMTFTRADEPG